MYISAKEIRNHAEQKLNNHLTKNTEQEMPSQENASFQRYGVYWCTAISIDIREFKKICEKFYKPAVIKLVQAFSSSLIRIMKKNPMFKYSTVNGDEVIGVFATPSKEATNTNFKTAILCNSFVNYLFPKILAEKGYTNINFKAGVGVWTSNDNSIVRYGEKGSQHDSDITVIGSSINWSSHLAKISLKNNNCEILFNETTKQNLTDERYKNDAAQYSYRINDEVISWLNYRYNEYTE